MSRKHTFKPLTILTFIMLAFLVGRTFSQVLINELDSDTPGTDTLEFIELYDGGTGNTPLDGLVLVFFNGSGDVSYRTIGLDGHATDPDGYFVVGNPDVAEAGLHFPAGGLQNGPDAVALYRRNVPDFPNGTAPTTEGLIDALVYGTNDPEAAGLMGLLNPGQSQADEQGLGDKDNHSLQRFPNGSGGLRNTATFMPRPPTPGRSNGGETQHLEIHDVQGNGLVSPKTGGRALLAGNIVTGVAANGFFIQTPDDRQDDDPETSQGVFVYTNATPSVRIGDLVDIEGEVREYHGLTEIIAAAPPSVLSSDHRLPAPVLFDGTFPPPEPGWPESLLERFEGMRVLIRDGVVCQPSDARGEAWISASYRRIFREPGITHPGRAGLPVWDGNPERLVLDPDGLGLDVPPLCAGTRIDSLAGVLTWRFGQYQIQPTHLSVSGNSCLSPVRSRAGDEFTVGTLNLHRLMDDADDPLIEEVVVDASVFRRHLRKLSRYIREAMDCPDILAVQEVENESALAALAAQIQDDDSSVRYTAFLREGNDISGIDVGYLVRGTIDVDSVVQRGKTDRFEFGGAMHTLHDRPPFYLYFRYGGRAFAALNVHMRSLSGMDGPDSLRIRQKRHAQAEDVARRIRDMRLRDPDIRLLVLGDFNAFQFTDGYVDVLGQITGSPDPAGSLIPVTPIVDPPLLNPVFSLDPEERYSYVYEGSAQVLDHILITEGTARVMQDFAFARGNADAPFTFGEDEDSPLRASDHDGLVLFLDSERLDGVGANSGRMPSEIVLYGNFPNPFNPATQIDFFLPCGGMAVLSVYNVLGRKVKTLYSGFITAGSHAIRWEGRDETGRDVPSGIYVMCLESESGTRVRKMVLQR
ncbi:MAG TPA: T9SS type A sorting domain-containing protein [bacterium]|nr:T9SS type A sorting domain-containing protein [bacterium]